MSLPSLFTLLLLPQTVAFNYAPNQRRSSRPLLHIPHSSIRRTTTPLQSAPSSNLVPPSIQNNDDEAYQPYTGPQPTHASPEIFIQSVLHDDTIDDDLLWVPQTDTVSFRPLCFSTSSGYYVNLLRVRGSGLLSRHRHPGPVHGHVLKGSWRYLEHDWVATQGSYIFEPPGEVHTLVVPEGVEEMITLFHVTGALLYCDVDGKVVGHEDVFSKLEKAREYYGKVGLGEDFVDQFVR